MQAIYFYGAPERPSMKHRGLIPGHFVIKDQKQQLSRTHFGLGGSTLNHAISTKALFAWQTEHKGTNNVLSMNML